MNHLFLKYFCLVLVSSLIIFACNDNNEDKTLAPAQVLNPTYIATYGGAVIFFDLPDDPNLLYVKAVYKNSQNEEVFRACSHYTNSIEIDGFKDEEPQLVKLYSVSIGGVESQPVEITVVPEKSYIYLVQKSLKIESALGGIKISWNNPSQKMVHVYIDYTDGTTTRQRIFSSESENCAIQIRELEPVPYKIYAAAEDRSKNITATEFVDEVTPRLEQKINKAGWELIKNLSCLGDKWEGRMVNFWDDVIDINTNPNDNSYFIIHRDENGGSLRFLSATEQNPLMIVIDMHKQAIASRLVVWQRAFKYNSSNPSSTANSEYAYYQDDNLRAFNVFLTNDLSQATRANLWFRPTFVCDIGEPVKDNNGNIPQSEFDRAELGHEFELPEMSEPFRYIVIGLTASYGSEIQVCCSEITLFGLDNYSENP